MAMPRITILQYVTFTLHIITDHNAVNHITPESYVRLLLQVVSLSRDP
jgi:hypothetical protein